MSKMTFDERMMALVKDEYARITARYGEKYASLHEAESVLREEVEEAQEACADIATRLDSIHSVLRRMDTFDAMDEKILDNHFLNLHHSAINLAEEAIQIAACCSRARNGFSHDVDMEEALGAADARTSN